MSNSRPRRDGDRRPSDRDRDRDRGDRRDYQPDDEQQRRPGDLDLQESDSLTALKAILGKVANLLTSMQLTQDECISLVEQLYGSVLDMDLKLAGETDDKRKASILAHIQNTSITRDGGKLAVEYPKAEAPKSDAPKTDTPKAEAPKAASPRPVPAEPKPAPAEPAPAPEAAPAAVEAPDAPEATPEPTPEAAPQLALGTEALTPVSLAVAPAEDPAEA